jgi:protein tyrosine/serine phosphatase
LPSVFEKPDAANIQQAVDVLSKGGGVLVHCTHGQDRTGLVVGVYRVKHDGWSKDKAWDEMVHHDFHQELVGLVEFWLGL